MSGVHGSDTTPGSSALYHDADKYAPSQSDIPAPELTSTQFKFSPPNSAFYFDSAVPDYSELLSITSVPPDSCPRPSAETPCEWRDNDREFSEERCHSYVDIGEGETSLRGNGGICTGPTPPLPETLLEPATTSETNLSHLAVSLHPTQYNCSHYSALFNALDTTQPQVPSQNEAMYAVNGGDVSHNILSLDDVVC